LTFYISDIDHMTLIHVRELRISNIYVVVGLNAKQIVLNL